MTIKVRSHQNQQVNIYYNEKQFKILKSLGSGGFGTCYKAIISCRRNSFNHSLSGVADAEKKTSNSWRRNSINCIFPEADKKTSESCRRNSANNSFSTTDAEKKISRPFCLKKINRTSKKNAALQSFVAETKEELFRLEHPNIVKLLAATSVSPIKDDTKLDALWMAFELIDGCNLKTLLGNENESMDLNRMCVFGKNIACALDYVHSFGIVHLDLKPANVMVTLGGVCKLADFGCSQYVKSDPVGAESLLTGTCAYRAPELHCGFSPTPNCDVYALGICLWQFWSRVQPFEGMPQQVVIYNVVRKNLRPSFDVRDNPINKEYQQLAVQCWSSVPEQRSSLSDVIRKLDEIQNTSKSNVPCPSPSSRPR